MSITERRVLLFWSHIAKQCEKSDETNTAASDWITDAWYAGPNRSTSDLNSILQCPVFAPEIQSSITPLTCPDTALSEQIRKELLRPRDDMQLTSNPPHHSEVDNEEWMWILSTSKNTLFSDLAQTPSVSKNDRSNEFKSLPEQLETSTLDKLMSGVESFIDGTSTINGVETNNKPLHDNSAPIVVDPTLFMNILHTALKAKSGQELSDKLSDIKLNHNNVNDPFFSEDDYLLMDPSNDDESDDGVNADIMNMEDVMNAMDAELQEGLSTSRAWDNVTGINCDDDIARNAHVLSNLLKSIDSSGGGPGPTQNILQELDGTDHLPINGNTDNDPITIRR
jgi:hypothetical protein